MSTLCYILGVANTFSPDYDLSKTSHLVFWISFAYSEKTGVYVSVYYHPCPEK